MKGKIIMTNQEARDILYRDFMGKEVDIVESIEARKMALSALERQIPKRPEKEDESFHCAVCGSFLGYSLIGGDIYFHGNHCQRCGQALTWMEDEE